jgi:hypothetical protein
MARKRMTARKKQERNLRKLAKEGQFTLSTVNGTTASEATWCISNNLTWDYNDNGAWSAVIDGQHARSLAFATPTASQMGYGVYDVTVRAIAALGAIDPFDTTDGVGQVQLRYVEPTVTRMNALRELKTLEIMDDEDDIFSIEDGSSETAKPAHPLLTRPLDEDEDDASADIDANTLGRMGRTIIRFGWNNEHEVYRQSAFTKNLNPDVDKDVLDNYELQKYTLLGGDEDYFSVLKRYEDYLNPMIQSSGQRMQEEKWAYPMQTKVCATASQQFGKFGYIANGQSAGQSELDSFDLVEHTFTGVRALGGLMEVKIPEWYSHLETGANNDMQLEVTLHCKKWIPLA